MSTKTRSMIMMAMMMMIMKSTPPPDGDSTWAFDPGTASTPHNGGEQYEMQAWMHEQSGLPDTSYEEAPLLRRTGSIGDLQKKAR